MIASSRTLVERSVAGLLLCALAGAQVACGTDAVEDLASRAIDLTSVGIRVQLGDREDDRFVVLRRPIDAAFVGEHVVVLDASQPWGRVFDRQGNFVRSIVRRGDGPGEVRSSRSIAATDDGQVLFVHPRGILRVDLAGTPTFTFGTEGVIVLRGLVEACDGTILALGRRLSQTGQGGRAGGPGFVLRVGADLASSDTLLMLDALRVGDSRRPRTSFLSSSPSGLLLQTEEESNHRLIEVECDGTIRREMDVGPFGAPERFVPHSTRPNILLQLPEEPPYPGGVVGVQNVILWAALVRDTLSPDTTRLTVVTAYEPDGLQREVILRGWVQLFDSDDEGMLLVGLADDLYPRVVMVDGNALLQRMRRVRRTPANSSAGAQ